MREIKFRSWDGNLMRYSHDGWNESTDVFSELWDILQSHYGHSVMQYTGLKDKNGKEIYEGDIVACNVGFGACEVEVHWSNLNFGGGWYPFMHCNPEKSEVVGNLHENPEPMESP